MPFSCVIYGLGVEINIPLAGMRGLPAASSVDVTMAMGFLPPELGNIPESAWHAYFTSPEFDESGQPTIVVTTLSLASSYYRIRYSDETIVVVDASGSRVWAVWQDPATLEDTATYLLGPILGFLLRLRGVTCLHGSAVAIGGHAIALVGPSGAGKSSTAAAFAKLGYSVLTDDVVALADLGDEFRVQPAYPRVRLWPDSVQSMFGSEDALPQLTPNWEKCYLDLNGPPSMFQSEALPLAAVYFLGDRSTDARRHAITGISPRQALMMLVSDTYATRLLRGGLRADEFELLGRLVESVPLRALAASDDLSRISELCQLIVDDFKQMSAVALG